MATYLGDKCPINICLCIICSSFTKSKYLLNTNQTWTNTFLDPTFCFWDQDFFESKMFWATFFRSKIFWTKHFFIKHFFDLKFFVQISFWTKESVGPNLSFNSNSFSPKIIGSQIFSGNSSICICVLVFGYYRPFLDHSEHAKGF